MKVEILIATMHRTSLDFLSKMFKNNNLKDFNILIINQTTKKSTLKSNSKNIRVINETEFGVPKSRNLALKNAVGDICLMADDDIIYLPNLKYIILEAYQKNPKADMISFEALNEFGNPYTDYPKTSIHTTQTLKKIYTWVISFKRESYVKNNIFYNNHFGFGATFKGSEEYVFLRNAFDKRLKAVHEPKAIVIHPNESSGRHMGSDNAFFSKPAVEYRYNGNLSYIWLVKYVVYMWIYGYIKFNEIPKKFKIGLDGIRTYKKLEILGEINSIDEN